MKKILAILGIAILVLAAIILVRASTLESKQVKAEPVTDLAVDSNAAAQRLAGAVRFPTISHEGGRDVEAQAFLGLHRYLQASFPLVHQSLRREVVAEYSLLYTWPGSKPELPPILLMSHTDVVPIEPGTEKRWIHPPFSGAIAGGYIWGRGTIDDKVSVLGVLEGVELLLARGFQPERTVLLAFGHDEEVGGTQGAAAIARLLESRGVRPAMILDEGGIIAKGMVPGLDSPVAMISTAEKGFVTVELTARSQGGHSSMPPRSTAIGMVAAAVQKLEQNPMPARIDGATRESFDFLAPELPLGARLPLANLWLFAPLVRKQFSGEPASDARMRTTTAATMIRGGVKENVLPSEGRAWVNFRILPGDTVASVLEHVRETVGPGIQVSVSGTLVSEPSPQSKTDEGAFRLLQTTLAQVFPGTLAAPNLLAGATDTKHFRKLSPNVYRFIPVSITAEDLERIHGTNERVGVQDYAGAVRFYAQLVRNAAGGSGPPPKL
ncbi:MAG TPA: M20 family peptidase [Thermoanaerobaculia bacterium]|nr:M20 family peptidase [Thermoanaerobaculia bacterium]